MDNKKIIQSSLLKVLKQITGSFKYIEENLKKEIPNNLNELVEMVANDHLDDLDDDDLEELAYGYKDIEDLDLRNNYDDIEYISKQYLHSTVLPAALNRLQENLQWEGKRIKAWRNVVLHSLEDLDTKNLGVHWAYTKDFAQPYDGTEEGDEYLIEASVPLESINFDSFLNRIISHWGETEREISLKKGMKVYDVKISKDDSLLKEYESLSI